MYQKYNRFMWIKFSFSHECFGFSAGNSILISADHRYGAPSKSCKRIKDAKFQIRGVKIVPMWEFILLKEHSGKRVKRSNERNTTLPAANGYYSGGAQQRQYQPYSQRGPAHLPTQRNAATFSKVGKTFSVTQFRLISDARCFDACCPPQHSDPADWCECTTSSPSTRCSTSSAAFYTSVHTLLDKRCTSWEKDQEAGELSDSACHVYAFDVSAYIDSINRSFRTTSTCSAWSISWE